MFAFATRCLVVPALVVGAVLLPAPTAAHAAWGETTTVATECSPESRRVDPLMVTVASCGALGAASAVVYVVATLREEDQE
ncbi:hypothetical protein BCA37_22345 [Mycobacterium sp. djl-10]|nr:hypothetical protein BCA37_22345 [Mycobacterium sp. djl-10]